MVESVLHKMVYNLNNNYTLGNNIVYNIYHIIKLLLNNCVRCLKKRVVVKVRVSELVPSRKNICGIFYFIFFKFLSI